MRRKTTIPSTKENLLKISPKVTLRGPVA